MGGRDKMTDERLNDAKSGRLPRDVFEAHRQAAADLVPLLRSNALETESNGWVAEANLDAIEAAGLLRLGVPEKFGGTPVDQATMMAVLEELARGCGSTGWVMGDLPGRDRDCSGVPSRSSGRSVRWSGAANIRCGQSDRKADPEGKRLPT